MITTRLLIILTAIICFTSLSLRLGADPFDREALKIELLEIDTPASEIVGQWYTPQNVVDFYSDGTFALQLKKDEIGNLESINGTWEILGDAKMRLVFTLPTGGTRTDVVWAGIMKGSLVTIDENDGLLFYSRRRITEQQLEAQRLSRIVEEGEIVGRWWDVGSDGNIVNFYDDGKMAIDLRGPTNDGLSVLRAAWRELPTRQLFVEFVYPDMETKKELVGFTFKNGDLMLKTEEGKVTWHKRVPPKGIDVPEIVGRWVETSKRNGDFVYIYGNGTMNIQINYKERTGTRQSMNGVWFVHESGIMKADFATPDREIRSTTIAYEVEDENHILLEGEDGEVKRFERFELVEARRDVKIAEEVLEQEILADGLPGSRWQENGGTNSIIDFFADGTLAVEREGFDGVEVISGLWEDRGDGTMRLEYIFPNGNTRTDIVFFKFDPEGELKFKYQNGDVIVHKRLK